MNNIERHVSSYPLKNYLNNAWTLNVYVLKGKPQEIVCEENTDLIFEKYLNELEGKCLSDEFEYLKVGFAFLHYGRRGVCLSIWHVGQWNCTFEIFCNTWYCYGREIFEMELLDIKEPKICIYELSVANKELQKILAIINDIKQPAFFRDKFIEINK